MEIIYDICDKNLPNDSLMHLQTVLIKPYQASQFKFHFLSSENEYSKP